MRWLLALALLAPYASAQLALFHMQGSTEVPLTALLDFGATEAGEEKSVRIRIRNTGTALAVVSTLSVRGAGFSVTGGLTPFGIDPGKAADILVRFSASSPADYSATLQIESLSVFLVARVTPGLVLTVFPVCAASGDRVIEFGSVQRGDQRICNLQLQNPGTEAVTVPTLNVSGGAFSGPGIPVPFTLAPGQTVPFTIRFQPPVAGAATGLLTVGSRTYDLKGTATERPLPRPLFDFGPMPFASAQQRTLTLRLPEPAPYSASGLLDLSFVPDSPVAPGDPAVAFLPTARRSVPFTVAQGSTDVRLDGDPSLVFQTGTTAGRIRFVLSGPPHGFVSDPTTVVTIPPAAIALQSAEAGRIASGLLLRIVAYDNTYTAGSMAFRFYDTQGNPMGDAIPADFTGAFRAFFGSLTGGSAFEVTLTFPVTGDITRIGSVEADLANSAGVTRTQRLTFP